ncbi:MAG: GNAT family N-acetyltransferase [Clostridia bacterium]|nr:GNAT family N-acetyltransferase [Clostridia bacterium]
MDYILLNDLQKEGYENDILALMQLCDKDFIPPLSARASTLQKDLSFSNASGNVCAYFDEMIKQKVLVIIDDDKFLGFVSYKENYSNDVINKNTFPNIYVSTLMLAPESRGKHLTEHAYNHLFNTLYPKHNIYTRTWSTNLAHIRILSKFNFNELHRIKNDRGENIDTVYFEKTR